MDNFESDVSEWSKPVKHILNETQTHAQTITSYDNGRYTVDINNFQKERSIFGKERIIPIRTHHISYYTEDIEKILSDIKREAKLDLKQQKYLKDNIKDFTEITIKHDQESAIAKIKKKLDEIGTGVFASEVATLIWWYLGVTIFKK